MINFDNAATTYPKPKAVADALRDAVLRHGGNPGRSGHDLSLDAAAVVFRCREKAAAFFKAKTENTIFTSSATAAINMAIKGVLKKGSHIIISSLEHNSVARPVYNMYKKGLIEFSVFNVYEDKEKTLNEIVSLIRKQTSCLCCTAASNVSGQVLPIKEIGAICKENSICFICDCAQGAGVIPISLDDGVNIICSSGHKGLYGPAGTGLLISDGKYKLDTIIEGGNGSSSAELEQSSQLPERLESGTLNVPGICGLSKGIDFVNRLGTEKIKAHEERLCNFFLSGAKTIKNIKFYTNSAEMVPIVSFNIDDYPSEVVASYLSDKGFALRGGLHCAALAHNFLGTTNQGTVRFSPSYFNSENQVAALIRTLRNFK